MPNPTTPPRQLVEAELGKRAKILIKKILTQEHQRHDDAVGYYQWVAEWGNFDAEKELQALINTAANSRVEQFAAELQTLIRPHDGNDEIGEVITAALKRFTGDTNHE